MINHLKFWKSSSAVFVVVNILVAFTGFLRSFIFIKFLNLEQLGAITMVNTVAASLSLFQFGLINGGYRIIALGKKEEIEKTNNLIFSFISVISILLFIIALIFQNYGMFQSKVILFISVIIGILMLVNNWVTNFLIGSRDLRRLNIANIVSVCLSLFSLLTIYIDNFYGALFSLLVQPLAFLLISFSKKIKVTKFYLDINYFKYILSFGFVPFLAGIFFLLYSQVERWTISSYLGNEDLGKLYLFYLVISLSVLIPTSVSSLFFPGTIKSYNDGNLKIFNASIKKNFIILIGYAILLCIFLLFVFKHLISLIFPFHLNFLEYVYYAIPGIVFRILADPFSLYFNAKVKLKAIFLSDIGGISLYVFLILGGLQFMKLDLFYFIICFNLYFLCKLIILVVNFLLDKRKGKDSYEIY